MIVLLNICVLEVRIHSLAWMGHRPSLNSQLKVNYDESRKSGVQIPLDSPPLLFLYCFYPTVSNLLFLIAIAKQMQEKFILMLQKIVKIIKTI